MANIREVAALAGVSISSVSNVLNGRVDQMRSETRARIEQAIGELNYQPNRIITQPKKRQPRMFGLLVPSIVNPSFAALAHEVELAARNTTTGCCSAAPGVGKRKKRNLLKTCSPTAFAA